MEFKKFEYLINLVKKSSEKRHKVGNFIEKELANSSFVYFNFGENLESTIVYMLADYYKCWWTEKGVLPNNETWYTNSEEVFHKDNDIEWWLYEDVDKKVRYSDGRGDMDVNSLKDFYNYLESNLDS